MHPLKMSVRRGLSVVVVATVLLALSGPSATANGGRGGDFPPVASGSCDPSTGACSASSSSASSSYPISSLSPLSATAGSAAHPADCPVAYTYHYVVDMNGAPFTLNPSDNLGYTLFSPVTQPEQFVLVLCQGTVIGTLLAPLGGNPATTPPVTGADLAQQAYASFKLAAPAPRMAPSADKVVVQFPTWLWVDAWKSQTATASVPGLSSTVTASPVSSVWTMGDGGKVACNGAAKPYDFNVPDSQQSTDCSYTYHSSSAGRPGDTFQGSVTVTYGASWTATNGSGGNLGPLSVTTNFTVKVSELQAINSLRPS